MLRLGPKRKYMSTLYILTPVDALTVSKNIEFSCFLVTYYFTHQLLPKFGRSVSDDSGAAELVAFVRKYGAYMKLHTCLAYSAALKCDKVINELLALAEHDHRHREVISLFHRRHALILYEPVSRKRISFCIKLGDFTNCNACCFRQCCQLL